MSPVPVGPPRGSRASARGRRQESGDRSQESGDRSQERHGRRKHRRPGRGTGTSNARSALVRTTPGKRIRFCSCWPCPCPVFCPHLPVPFLSPSSLSPASCPPCLRTLNPRIPDLMDFATARRDSLVRYLRRHVSGEVRFDDTSRALYSTDASHYQIQPLGVVLPKTIDDLTVTVQIASDLNVPITARGGGHQPLRSEHRPRDRPRLLEVPQRDR